jgi:nitroreductase
MVLVSAGCSALPPARADEVAPGIVNRFDLYIHRSPPEPFAGARERHNAIYSATGGTRRCASSTYSRPVRCAQRNRAAVRGKGDLEASTGWRLPGRRLWAGGMTGNRATVQSAAALTAQSNRETIPMDSGINPHGNNHRDPGSEPLMNMSLVDAIATRVSAAKLAEPGPDDEQLMAIMNAGMRAPDHGRLTPWRFIVVEGKAREKLGSAFAAHRKRMSPSADEKKLQQEAAKANRAPVIIVVAAHVVDHPSIPRSEQILAAAAGIQNMLLTTHALGLGAIWRTGSASRDPEVRRSVGFLKNETIVGFVYIGTPERLPPPRRVNVTPLVSWL